ncbi:MAG: tricarballylate utilization 4Fe-4S protein TcuB [Chloroflexota bacterium]|nr:tricarballylate utilization 4Fe-4S protein TcuB [Chloroflexota bacterium]MDE3193653.1 tricarballylate utilization 4Fe-4S protein TcuB [Chloroflexota bacterium]
MPLAPDLAAEARRQLTICNACRYCEGYCATFQVLELRPRLSDGDISVVGNVCHDCRGCYQACMFAPPHEFAINIPLLLSQVRTETYATYAWPSALATLFGRAATGSAIAAAVGLIVMAGISLATGGGARFFAADAAPGSFYRIVPYFGMVIPAMLLSLYALLSFGMSAAAFSRDARIRLTELFAPRALVSIARDALTLHWMSGGGYGCYYPEKEKTSETRRAFHVLLVAGFISAFLSTTVAAIYQELLGVLPPYGMTSLPVILGMAGGAAMIVGATGLLALKVGAAGELISRTMLRMDVAFLVVFDLVSITGMALLFLRDTPLMGTLLLAHFAALAALYATIPYGKFAHVVYRLLTLLETRRDVVAPPVAAARRQGASGPA